MKSWSRLISLLLVFVMLLGVMAGCVENKPNPVGPTDGQGTGNPSVPSTPSTPSTPDDPSTPSNPVDPTDPSGDDPSVEHKPQRPDDPGVIPPLDSGADAPENGVVWDMEKLPNDLVADHWATAKYEDAIGGNMKITGAKGKGYKGSRAMGITQSGAYHWADVYSIGMAMDDTAIKKWVYGDIFWIWYDSTEAPGAMMMELEVNGKHMKIGTEYYVMADGAKTAELAGTLPEGYNGAGYARIPLLGNFKGWVGVKVEAFDTQLKKVTSFTLHFTGIPKGKTLYLDNFCMSDADKGPMGAGLTTENKNVASSDKPVWDMEKLPADLIQAYWASKEYESSTLSPENFMVLSKTGKGVNGSKALHLFQGGNYHWADGTTISLTNDKSAVTNWETGDVLWFYADSTEMRNNVTMDLWIDNKKPTVGATYYYIDKDLNIAEAGTLPVAYQGVQYARIPIGAGYTGWIGVPLSAYGDDIVNVMNLYFHLGYSGDSGNAQRSLYLDEFWVLKSGEKPKTATVGGDLDKLLGKVPTEGSDFKVPGEVWGMENVSSDPVADGLAALVFKDHEEFITNNTFVRVATGKGYQGSAALQIAQLGNYGWFDVYEFDLSADSSAVTDWLDNNNVLWFWVDASEFETAVGIEVQLDGNHVDDGCDYFLVADDSDTGSVETIPEAWNGAGYGRMKVPAGFKGWVGTKLTSWLNQPYGATKVRFHIGYDDGSKVAGKNLFIDSFYLTANNTSPNGITCIKPVQGEWIKGGTKWWDPETLPDDPFAILEGNYSALILGSGSTSDHNTYAPYIDGSEEAGKGMSGGAALGYTYKQHGGEYELVVHWQNSSFAYNLAGQEMLWFWVDTSEFEYGIDLALRPHFKNAKNSVFYIWDGTNKPTAGMTDANGKMKLNVGFKGFLGLPLASYLAEGWTLGELWHVCFKYKPDAREELPATLYIDELWATQEGVTPNVTMGANDFNAGTVRDEGGSGGSGGEETGWTKGGTQWWTPEKLGDVTGDLIDAGKVDSQATANVDALLTAGKGFNAGTALEYKYLQWNTDTYSKSDVTVHHERTGFSYNWSDYEILWFWVDASDFTEDLVFEVLLGSWRKPVLDTPYYTWDGENDPVEGKMVATYNGATHGRIKLAAGYKGFIGIPLSNYVHTENVLDLGQVWDIRFYIEPAAGERNALPKSLYIDEIWLSKANEVPNVTVTTPDPEPDPNPDPDPEPEMDPVQVGNMENLPADSSEWISCDYADQAPGSVTLAPAAGKGLVNSAALQITYNGGYHWSQVFKLDPSKFLSVTDWTDADMLWIWIDASALTADSELELVINGTKPASSSKYYVVENGASVEKGSLINDWENKGRIPVAKGITGYIGVSLEAFGNPTSITEFRIHFAGNGIVEGLNLYMDELWITGPTGVPGEPTASTTPDPTPDPEPEEPEWTKGGTQWWTPEKLGNISGDLIDAGKVDGQATANVDALLTAGKGFNASTALEYKYLQWNTDTYSKSDVTVHHERTGFSYNWSDYEILWFWVDASDFGEDFIFEVLLGSWRKPVLDSTYYTWDGVNNPVEGTMVPAWNNANYARIKMTAGYKGFIGIPLSNYVHTENVLDLGQVWDIRFYIEPAAGERNALPKSLYIDELWLTAANEVPNVTPLKLGGEKLWDASTMPENPYVANQDGSKPAIQYLKYTNQGHDFTGVMEGRVVEGKGFNAGAAVAYTYFSKDNNDWNAYLRLHWQESSFKSDWTGAEILWVWIDTTDVPHGVNLEISPDGRDNPNGTAYLLDSTGKVTETTTSEYNKVSLPQKFVGWVGIKLADVDSLNIAAIWEVYFNYQPNTGIEFPCSLYIGQMWLTAADEVPNA